MMGIDLPLPARHDREDLVVTEHVARAEAEAVGTNNDEAEQRLMKKSKMPSHQTGPYMLHVSTDALDLSPAPLKRMSTTRAIAKLWCIDPVRSIPGTTPSRFDVRM